MSPARQCEQAESVLLGQVYAAEAEWKAALALNRKLSSSQEIDRAAALRAAGAEAEARRAYHVALRAFADYVMGLPATMRALAAR